MLRIANTIARTRAEGPHERCAIWVAGCDLACPGCCNPGLFDAAAAPPWSEADVAALLDRALQSGVEGITVLGGEPLQQAAGLVPLLEGASTRGLGVIVYSGYTLGEARARDGFDSLWAFIDTMVDGRFDARQPERERRFIGSRNQRLRHHTARYASPDLWRGPTQIEVRVDAGGRVDVHGMPRPVASLIRALKPD